MSKKNKVIEKPPVPIIPIFDQFSDQLWWNYKMYSEEEITKIKEFFVTYVKELSNFMTPNLYENMNIIAKNIGNNI